MTDDDPVAQAMKDALDSRPDALFSPEEREKIESLVEDPRAQPGYELQRGALVWHDEIAPGFGACQTMSVAWWKLHMLQYYRTMSWRPEELEKGAKDFRSSFIAASRAVWEKAYASGLRWIGFLPSRVDPKNLAVLIEFEKAEFGDPEEGDGSSRLVRPKHKAVSAGIGAL